VRARKQNIFVFRVFQSLLFSFSWVRKRMWQQERVWSENYSERQSFSGAYGYKYSRASRLSERIATEEVR